MTLLLMALAMTGTAELEVDSTGHVFISTEGIEVALAAVRPSEPKRALIRLTVPGRNRPRRSGSRRCTREWRSPSTR